jgi:single-strand DNA-binding protein
MNVLTLAGRLGQAPRTAKINRGDRQDTVINLNLAVDQRVKQPDGTWANETLWFDVSMFGTRGDSLASFLVKGQWVGATGELKIRHYTNREGVAKVALELLAKDIWPLGKSTASGETQARPQHRDQLTPDRSYRAPAAPAGDYEMPPDDDIPF